ncbi:nucleotide pyrophosphatase [Nocardioides guangzhouensis]|uniref:Nucleotide pyrophosphatase n=1 Tax=Nocardioides guangzhouensis TaxID=2497878 RepID=A0A4Q4ZK23_9ACTN|nr:alkaline phosphatase family protein [Nocardioides guangzhouensis]RYP88707.1 nucleotide pyrophosphatase [Nocardioides guangzhouensis]
MAPSPEQRAAHRERAVAALCAPDLAAIVDLVVWVEDGTAYAANHLGRVRWNGDDARELLAGVDPIGSEDPMAFLPYEREVADPSPRLSTGNAYPYAAARLHSFFADPERSPDLAIVHTPRHRFLDEGGHIGEHGSLDVIQSRAPLVLSGAGVARRGYVDDHARLVDVGPTLAVLSGVPEDALADADGTPLDGRPLTAYLDGPPPRHVVGILWDGAPSGDLLHLAETGELPALARLVERGTALRGGAVAEFPSVTLTNHTAILTGVGPGRHGVMGNVYYDRATGETVVPNDETTWHRSAEWLKPSVRTVFEMVGDLLPPSESARTASVNEAIDRGADYSTMQVIRATSTGGAGSLDDLLPDPTGSPYLGEPTFLDDRYFRWGVRVDDVGLDQVLQLWADPSTSPPPRLTWWAHVVTDAGHHGAGPRSEMARDALRQSDARLGRFLDHLDEQGVLDDVAFLLTADHGFEGSHPDVTGSWRGVLEGLGVPFLDEGPGLVYFTD